MKIYLIFNLPSETYNNSATHYYYYYNIHCEWSESRESIEEMKKILTMVIQPYNSAAH